MSFTRASCCLFPDPRNAVAPARLDITNSGGDLGGFSSIGSLLGSVDPLAFAFAHPDDNPSAVLELGRSKAKVSGAL